MQKIATVILCCALAAAPAMADPALAPGKPAGVRPAEGEQMTYIYGGVLLFAGLLFGIIGTTGNPAASSTAATSTNN